MLVSTPKASAPMFDHAGSDVILGARPSASCKPSRSLSNVEMLVDKGSSSRTLLPEQAEVLQSMQHLQSHLARSEQELEDIRSTNEAFFVTRARTAAAATKVHAVHAFTDALDHDE